MTDRPLRPGPRDAARVRGRGQRPRRRCADGRARAAVARFRGADQRRRLVSVPDRLEFEGRAPVLVRQPVADAHEPVKAAVTAAGGEDVEQRSTGGSFASASTPPDTPSPVWSPRRGTRRRGRPYRGSDLGCPRARTCGSSPHTAYRRSRAGRGVTISHGVDKHVVDGALALTRVLIGRRARIARVRRRTRCRDNPRKGRITSCSTVVLTFKGIP